MDLVRLNYSKNICFFKNYMKCFNFIETFALVQYIFLIKFALECFALECAKNTFALEGN